VTERPGRVRLLSSARRLRREPLGRIDVSAQGEGGLLGVAVDPRFGQDNDFVYFFFTTSAGMEVARYRLRGTRLSRDATILDGIEAGAIHDSGRIRFGPDGARPGGRVRGGAVRRCDRRSRGRPSRGHIEPSHRGVWRQTSRIASFSATPLPART